MRAVDPTSGVLAGGGEMGALMRSLDWSRTPLGLVESWSQSLKTSVSICLASRFPILIWWGPEFVKLYNDAYAAIIGDKHPRALGAPGREVWPEIWDIIGPMLASVIERGEATWSADQMLPLRRKGYSEECYFTFSYSPIRDETGGVGGVFTAVSETTARVVGERRLAALRELAAATVEARTAEDACAAAARALAEYPADLPFALIYLLDADGQQARLAGAAGLAPDAPARPAVVELAGDHAAGAWPLGRVVRAGPLVLGDLAERFGVLPGGPWPEPTHTAVVLPIAQAGQERPAGVLVAGVSPRRALDDEYRGFLDLVAGQLAAAIADARANEAERARAEALVELDRAKTAFFSNVSHEFRTPLTLTLGPLEDLLGEARGPLSPSQRTELEVAHRNALRLLRLVNTLLDFSRIEAGRVQASYVATDVAAVTADLASTFRSAVERAGLRLVVDCPPLPAGIEVYVDRDMWEKVVLNLLSNALKFTFAGEIAVTLRPTADGRAVQLAVRDTGTGIAPAELPRLFERFHRVQGARARTHEGTGIGLALVQELVKLHGGAVSAESAPGVGTTFTVILPTGAAHLPPERIGAAPSALPTGVGAAPYVEEALRWLAAPSAATEAPLVAGDRALAAAAPESQVPAPAAARPAARRARVLLADDNADMRDYVARLLGARYEVEVVSDGTAALAAARAQPPDLVLSDVMMPGLDGFALLRALRADPRTREVPVVLLSARAGEEARVEGLDAGADDYLIKPFAARELLARVSTHLELARMRAEATRREQAARAAAEAERARLRDLFEQAPAAIAVLRGPEHVYEFANRGYLAIAGPTRTYVGRSVREAFPELAGQGVYELLDRVYQTGEPFVGRELPLELDRRGTGALETVYFDFVYQPIKAPDGAVEGIFVHAIEVTDQVLARRRVEGEVVERQHAERLLAGQKAILEQIARGVPLQDTLEALARFIEAESAGMLCSILLLDRDGVHLRHGAAPSLPPGYNRGIDGVAIGPAVGSCGTAAHRGEPVVVSDIAADPLWADYRDLAAAHGLRACWSTPIRSSDGRVLGTFAVYHREPHYPSERERELVAVLTYLASIAIERHRNEEDRLALLAGERAARAEAEAAVRTRDEFLATVTHDLKNPLASIRGRAQLLLRRAARDPARQDDVASLAAIEGQTGMMRRLLDQLLDVTRLQAGQALPLRAREVDLAALVARIVDEYRPTTDRHELVVELPPRSALVGEWDADRLEQIVANLLGNAIKYSPGGGPIAVRLSMAQDDGGSWAVLVVQDHGLGIPAADLPHLFERFHRGSNVAGTIPGMGIGLASTAAAIAQHGGTIAVASEEGRGTTFTVRLPLPPLA